MTEPQISDEVVSVVTRMVASEMARALPQAFRCEPIDAQAIAGRLLAAAVPLLYQQWEAELRAKIATEIEAKLPRSLVRDGAGWDDFIMHECYSTAARIARGVQPGGSQ